MEEEWIIDAGIGVVPSSQNVATVWRFDHAQSRDCVANDAGYEGPREENDEEIVDLAATV